MILFVAPPKVIIDASISLSEANLVPSAKLYLALRSAKETEKFAKLSDADIFE